MGHSEIGLLKETGKHSYHRRAFSHDYFAPFIYHIILKKNRLSPFFGMVTGDARIPPGNPGCAFIEESTLGKTIAKAIIHLPFQHHIIRLHQFRVMPDHVHLLIQILWRSEYHLDFYIYSLTARIAARYSTMMARTIAVEDIFEAGYCDKPLYDDRSLDGLYRYIQENPHRLAMRQQFPHFFQRARKLEIGEDEYEAYGNLFLFRNPDKEAVKISSKLSPEENMKRRAGWLSGASKGTVLVSPFISREEKEIRAAAEALGANIILITHEAFGERYKPAAHDFDLCSDGRLLIISLGLPPTTPLTRPLCEQMNALAEKIALQL